MNIDGIDLTTLTDDGDTLDVGERHRLRLRVEVDQDASINDYDSDGKVQWCERGERQRPAGFDGAAEKLWAPQNCGAFWWRPWDAKDWAAMSADDKRRTRQRICDLMAFGFKQFGLQLLERVHDSFGGEHWLLVDQAWIGGVDEFYPELVLDLAIELSDINQEAT